MMMAPPPQPPQKPSPSLSIVGTFPSTDTVKLRSDDTDFEHDHDGCTSSSSTEMISEAGGEETMASSSRDHACHMNMLGMEQARVGEDAAPAAPKTAAIAISSVASTWMDKIKQPN